MSGPADDGVSVAMVGKSARLLAVGPAVTDRGDAFGIQDLSGHARNSHRMSMNRAAKGGRRASRRVKTPI